MPLGRIAREGFVAGVIGAGAVAVWFLLVDLLAGHALFTPAMLGSALFFGLRDPAAVQVTVPAVVGYTMVHVIMFTLTGMIAAAWACLADRFPSTLFLAVFFFVAYEVGFYIVNVAFAEPLLGALAWYNVAAGNAIAAVGMGFYLWRVHPQLRTRLERQPLGTTGEATGPHAGP
jgi:hypothetical protein